MKIIGVHTPAQPKNLIINGAFDIFQEKGGNTTTVNTATGSVISIADMMNAASFGTTVKNFSVARSTDVPSQAQSGFASVYSALYTQITSISSFAATDQVAPFLYFMEGTDYANIHNKQVTFGFWIKGSVVGTYSFKLSNNDGSRSYIATFPINGANTWEFKSITVTLDNTGTWIFDSSGRGLTISIGGIGGSGLSISAGSWQSANAVGATGATNWMATAGATLRVAQFSCVQGPMGYGPTGFQRAGDTIQGELAMCQRYLFSHTIAADSRNAWYGFSDSDNSWRAGKLIFPVTMRATPSVINPGNTGMYLHKPGLYNTTFSAVPVGVPTFAPIVDQYGCGFAGVITNPQSNSVPMGFYYTTMIFDARL